MKRFIRCFNQGEKGFTLIELLVSVAILGTLAAVALPNIGKFIGRGQSESYQAELHTIQTAVMSMLVDSDDAVLTPVGPTNDMDNVLTTDGKVLSDYLTIINADGTVKSNATYTFTADGKVTQTIP